MGTFIDSILIRRRFLIPLLLPFFL
jgi:hypothetical protein